MTTIRRRVATPAGLVLIAAAMLVPSMNAGADVGPVAVTTTVVPSMNAGADVGPVAVTTTVVPYSCRGVGFAIGVGTLPTQDVTVTLGAPTEVTAGQPFVVTVDITPLSLANPGFPLDAPARIQLTPQGATGTNSGQALSGNVVFSGSTATVPRSTMTATPTVAAGGVASFTTARIQIVVGATGFECVPAADATRATISTAVVGSLTTSSTTSTTAVPSTTVSTLPGETTTSTSSTTSTTVPVTAPPPTTMPTTVPPTSPPTTSPPTTQTTTPAPTTAPPATPEGPAVTVRSSASATFTCNIYDSSGTQFNQNPLPPSNVTITMTLPDKVGVGGQVQGLVRFDPGPANGPIRLNAGTVDFAASLGVSGGTPATIEATGGPNADVIPPNSPSRSPEMAFSVTSSAPAGGEVAFGIRQVEVRATVPSVLITRCTPGGSSMNRVAGVAVVAGSVAPPADLQTEVQAAGGVSGAGGSGSRGGAASARDGFANCAEAKAAGRGTIVRTDPAYRPWLDPNGNGLACERSEVLGTSLASTGTSTTGFGLGWSVLLLAAGAVLIRFGASSSSRRHSDAVTDVE